MQLISLVRAAAALPLLLLVTDPKPSQPPVKDPPAEQSTAPSDAALTIYNGNFAVVRQGIHLDLQRGVTQTSFSDVAGLLEPDSVVLRDPAGKYQLQVLEQNFRNDPLSQGLLLYLNEGKTIQFRRNIGRGPELVDGKILRSGYEPSNHSWNGQPIVESEGKIIFNLPGEPVFDSLGNDTILKPTLSWSLQSDTPGPLNAELSYITNGMTWEASYNLVAPPRGDTLDMVGWVTMKNDSGKEFDNARVKLMAGDVNKMNPMQMKQLVTGGIGYAAANDVISLPVQEKAFDEFHLYTLQRPLTLHDRETKQVEFVTAQRIHSQRIYVYDGAQLPNYGWSAEMIRSQPEYGTQSNTKVWVMQEFKNSKENNLGMPLPKGRLRFYRRDDDGQLEFTGENLIEHTPENEMVRVYTGNSFDIVGERKRTAYHIDLNHQYVDESFEIRVRNHKKEPVDVRVVEHMYRWSNWKIQQTSDEYHKTDSRTVEFPVTVKPDGEEVITYTVHYTW